MGIKVGIDLGTTFSAVARIDDKTGKPVIIPNTDGEHITPSVIQFLEDGSIIVGAEAKEAFEAGESGCASVFKRSMGKEGAYCTFYGKSYTAVELSAILLRYLKEVAEAETGETIDEAVVTVPAYFYHKERKATMDAARLAGLKIRQIINEPTAAALNYGADHWRENAKIMVYDLGGGTFDVTLVQMKKDNQMRSLQTTGDHTLGGKDWDARLCTLIESKVEGDTGMTVDEYPEIHSEVLREAEHTKKQLTNRKSVSVNLKLPEYGRYTTSVTLEEFNECTRDLITSTGNLCENLLQGLSIGWGDITDILLVGGSTRMSQVSEYLQLISGHKPLLQVNPDEAVALGAAIQVHLPLPSYSVISLGAQDEETAADRSFFQFKKKEPSMAQNVKKDVIGTEHSVQNVLSIAPTDVVAHAMGIIAVNKEGTHYINKNIVPANQTIPVKCAEAFQYYTSVHEENEVEIYVLQGTKAPLECQIIGKYVVSGIRHDKNKNPTILHIQYSYDVNGMIHVQARQEMDDFDLPIREEPVPDDMSKFELPIDQAEMRCAAEPLSLVMAVDVSGSMEGKPMEDALKAMCNFVDQFEDYPGEVQIGAIAVSDESQIVQPLTENLPQCKRSIKSIKSCMTGICNEGHPFSDIQSMFSEITHRRFAIVLADGLWQKQDVAVSAAKQCHRSGIEITGIGFGSANEQFLKDISSGDIQSMLVNQSELVTSFGKIAQEIGGTNTGKHGRETESNVSSATWLAINE